MVVLKTSCLSSKESQGQSTFLFSIAYSTGSCNLLLYKGVRHFFALPPSRKDQSSWGRVAMNSFSAVQSAFEIVTSSSFSRHFVFIAFFQQKSLAQR